MSSKNGPSPVFPDLCQHCQFCKRGRQNTNYDTQYSAGFAHLAKVIPADDSFQLHPLLFKHRQKMSIDKPSEYMVGREKPDLDRKGVDKVLYNSFNSSTTIHHCRIPGEPSLLLLSNSVDIRQSKIGIRNLLASTICHSCRTKSQCKIIYADLMHVGAGVLNDSRHFSCACFILLCMYFESLNYTSCSTHLEDSSGRSSVAT